MGVAHKLYNCCLALYNYLYPLIYSKSYLFEIFPRTCSCEVVFFSSIVAKVSPSNLFDERNYDFAWTI